MHLSRSGLVSWRGPLAYVIHLSQFESSILGKGPGVDKMFVLEDLS